MAQPSRFSFVEAARCSLPSRSLLNHQSARYRTIALCVFAVMLVVGGLELTGDVMSGTTTHAQQRRRPAATASPASQNATNANTTTATQTKRITPLRTTDSAEGSRVTITSDAPLNDYAAYRSGNRFYVVIPGADASAVRNGARGRGFEDAQVQRRGNDAVLSFRLNPGAKARVNQRFNRLDVVFDTPGEAASSAASNNSNQASANNQANANSSRPTPDQTTANIATTQGSPNQDARDTAAAATLAQQRALAERNAARDLAQRNLNNAVPDSGFNPADASSTDAANTAALPSTAPTEASPELSPTPATDEIAQAQTTAPPATSVVNPAANNSSSFATTVATVIKSNPLWVMLAVLGLVVGLFLFVRVARQSTAPPPALDKNQIEGTVTLASDRDIVTPPKPLAAATPAAGLLAASDAEPVTAPNVNTKAGIIAASILAAAAKHDQREDETKQKMSPSLVPSVSAPDETAASLHDEAATITAPVDKEAVARELQNLLDGKEYSDEILRQANDARSRELVASELVAALSTRNIARRDQARQAYIAYGYFDDATRDLRHAKTPVARVAAARALGMSANPDAVPPLIIALNDKSSEVRRAAIDSLATLRDPRAVEPLTKMRRRENKRVIPYRVIDHAITACTAVAATQLAADQPESGETSATHFVTLAPSANFARVEPENPLDIMRQAQASQQALVDSALKNPAAIEESPRDVQAEDTTHDATASIETTAFEVVQPEAIAPEAVQVEDVELEIVEPEVGQPEVVQLEPVTLEDDALPIVSEQLIEIVEPLDSGESLTEETSVTSAPVEHLEPTAHADEEQIAPVEFVLTPDSTLDSTVGAPPASSPSLAPEAGIDDATAFDISDLARPVTAAPDSAEIEPEVETQAFIVAPVSDAKQETKATPDEWLDLDFNETSPTAEEEAAYDDAPPELPASLLREMTLISATPDVTETSAGDAADYREQSAVEIENTAAVSSPSPGDDDDASPFALDLVPISENAEAATSHELQTIAPTTYDELETVAEVDVTHDEPATIVAIVEDEFEAGDVTHIPETLRARLANADARERVAAVAALGRMTSEVAVREIYAAFDDRAVEVRNAAAQALHRATTDHTGAFTRALREASPERRRNIGAAIAGSGLATHALKNLTGESRERTYEAFSLLFLMAKAGEFTPLLQAIEQESSTEVRLAVVKLLALSGQPEVLPAFRRLAVRGSLPPDVRSAVMEAVYQISNQPSNIQQRV